MATVHPDHPELVEVEVFSSLTGTRRMVMFRDEYEMSLVVGEHIGRRLREQLMPGAVAAPESGPAEATR